MKFDIYNSTIAVLIDLWDNIRICDNEKYPAYFYIEGKKITLKYEVDNDNS